MTKAGKYSKRDIEKFIVSYDLWKWLTETGASKKEEWPRYSEIKDWECRCGYCEVRLKLDLDIRCLMCPIYTACDLYYNEWWYAQSTIAKKKNANRIFKAIKKHLIHLNILDKKEI